MTSFALNAVAGLAQVVNFQGMLYRIERGTMVDMDVNAYIGSGAPFGDASLTLWLRNRILTTGVDAAKLQ